MFLLVSVRHVGAHPYELQHDVSIHLGKAFPRISRIRIIPSTQILARVFVYLPPFISQIWTLSVEWFWFLFWSILNGVTPKTSNTGGEDLFLTRSRVGHVLRPIFMLWLAKIWQWVHAENLCSILKLIYFDSWSWESFFVNLWCL